MKPVVLMIHGIFDKGTIFKTLAEFMEDLGMDTMHPDVEPNDGSESLEVLAQQVSIHVEKLRAQNRRVFLIGFSMGGLICRYFMQFLGGVDKVERWVSVSAPHNGTWTASLFWGKGVKQMRRGSSFLNRLNNSLDTLKYVPTMSIWTPYDLMILPAESSILSVGENRTVDCLAHPLMTSNKTVCKCIGDFFVQGMDRH